MAVRVGGIIRLTINGTQYRAKGNFTYDLGIPKKEAVTGADGVHGYKEMPKPPYIEGEITDGKDISLKALFSLADATVNLELANGKLFALYEAWYAGDGTGSSEEGAVPVRFEGIRAEEVGATV